jgi:outer membrane protein assembly factor BamB
MATRHGNEVAAFALMGALYTSLLCAASTDSWPMYQANPQHTGYIAQTLLPAEASFAWSEKAQASAPSGLAVANGLVLTTPTTYFNSVAPLVAQNLFTGETEWSQDFGAVFSVNQPAVADGVIYLQTSTTKVSNRLLPRRRNVQWRPFNSMGTSGLIIVNGSVYFDGGAYGGIYSVQGATGLQSVYRVAAVRLGSSTKGASFAV